MTNVRWIAGALGAAVTATALYLVAWPVPIDPQAWTPPPDPGLTGPYAENDALRDVERLFPEELRGPDFILVDRRGRLVTGIRDGRIMHFDPAAGTVGPRGLAGGRPLGFVHTPVEVYLAADPIHGLTGAKGRKQIPTGAGDADKPVRYAADVVVTGRGETYFVDASYKFGFGESYADFLEHGANGRLLQFDDIRGTSRVVLEGLYFPSGLALGPDDAYLLIAETSNYRVLRHWLSGDKAGTTETFIEALPGLPAHITWNGRDTFWLALYAPRVPAFDRWADRPWLRTLAYRLPRALQPKPARRAFVLGLDHDGKVVHNLQYGGADAYAPITSVREHEGWLYLGSLTQNGVGRIRAPSP